MQSGKYERLQAVIIVSEAPAERENQARELAAALICEDPMHGPCGHCRHCKKSFVGVHPDIITVVRGKDEKGNVRREIVVDQIRDVTAEAYVRANEASRKVFIILDAGSMNIPAQNAFLKLLEEPPGDVVFLLCAANAELLLPTIRSRCTILRAGTEEETSEPEAVAYAQAYLKALEQDDAALLRCCVRMEKMDTAAMTAFSAAARSLVCEILCGRADSGLSREELLRQERLLTRVSEYLRLHVGVRHICGLLSVQRRTAQMGGNVV